MYKEIIEWVCTQSDDEDEECRSCSRIAHTEEKVFAEMDEFFSSIADRMREDKDHDVYFDGLSTVMCRFCTALLEYHGSLGFRGPDATGYTEYGTYGTEERQCPSPFADLFLQPTYEYSPGALHLYSGNVDRLVSELQDVLARYVASGLVWKPSLRYGEFPVLEFTVPTMGYVDAPLCCPECGYKRPDSWHKGWIMLEDRRDLKKTIKDFLDERCILSCEDPQIPLRATFICSDRHR